MRTRITLGHVNDIADGAARGFDPGHTGRDTLFIVRRGQTLHGWVDRCPHEGETPLPYRRHRYLNAAGTRIVCFAHGAQFNIESGVCVIGPCLGQALTKLALSVSEDGTILAELDADLVAIIDLTRDRH